MMRSLKYIVFAFVLLITGKLDAQSTRFYKCYGNTGYDYARDVKEDNDTGYVVTGASSSFGPDNGEAYLLKLNKVGNFEWSFNYGGPGSEWGESLVVTHDSTYAIAGYTNSYGAGGFDFYLVRIGADGTPLWENYYGGEGWDRAYGMVQLPDSGFVLVGDSYSFDDGQQHGYMVRTDKNGEIVWTTSILEDEPSFFTDIDLDGDSIVVCGGIGDGGTESYDGYVVKYHIDGTFGWEKRIGEEHNDYFNAVYSEGGIYSLGGVCGYSYPDEDDNMWMYRMEDTGTEIIDTMYASTSLRKDGINDIVVRDFDLDYYYCGYSVSWGYGDLDNEPDIFMGKLTIGGVQFAAQNYGHEGADVAHAIDYCRDGGVVIAGDTKYFSTGGNNVVIIKMNHLWEPFTGDIDDIFSYVEYDDITNSLPTYLDSHDFMVYPNPFSDFIHLPEIQDGNYSVYTIDGQVILHNLKISETVDLSGLESGTYLLTVETDKGIYKKRLIKN